MDANRYSDSPIGRLVEITGHDARHDEPYTHYAYVPDPLPQELTLATETWQAITQATLSLGRLDQAGRQLPDPDVLVRPQIRKEAQSTSALEGTHAAFSEVLEADLDRSNLSIELHEILNYVETAELAFAMIRDRAITVDLAATLQARLVAGTESDTDAAGRLRDHQVLIGPQGSRVTEARFVPTPEGDLLRAGMDDWEAWLAGPGENFEPITRIALAHYQFETLHPFNDGNGRIGRLLMLLTLMQSGVLAHPLLTISARLAEVRVDYQDQLSLVSQTGDYEAWIRFVARVVRDQSDATTRKIAQLIELHEEIQATVRSNRIRGTGRDIAQDLLASPIVTAPYAANRYRVSFPAANNGIARLVEAEILQEMTGRRFDRVFAAMPILRLLER